MTQQADIDALKTMTAAGRFVETAEDIHAGRFARSARAHHGDEVTAGNREINAAQRVDTRFAVTINAAHFAQFDQRRGGRCGLVHCLS